MTQDALDRLAEQVKALLDQHNLADEVSMTFRVLVDVRRLELQRKTDLGARYMLIAPVLPDVVSPLPWDFALLGGLGYTVNSGDCFDSRYGGTEANILIAIKTWLVDLGPWRFPIPT
jgi:hypothetical protein